ncbi:hypothetical protein O5D80_005771 [Batrachochytrium dendrobatidis]|nr:hypothetical protein O5D80_005771 [Batrachochytrium dendrobatidis]
MAFFPPLFFHENEHAANRDQALRNSFIYPNAAELLEQQQRHQQNNDMQFSNSIYEQQQGYPSQYSTRYQLPRLQQQYQVLAGSYHKTHAQNTWAHNQHPLLVSQSQLLSIQQQQMHPSSDWSYGTDGQMDRVFSDAHTLSDPLDFSNTADSTSHSQWHIPNYSSESLNMQQSPQQKQSHHSLEDAMQLANFVTSLVFILWRCRSLSPLDSAFIQFQNYTIKLLNSTSNNVTPPVILTALKYVERLRAVTPAGAEDYPIKLFMSCPADASKELRVWITALSLADGFVNDNAYTVRSWSDVSGFSVLECVAMRKEFLEAIEHKLYITEQEYTYWLQTLESLLDQPEACYGTVGMTDTDPVAIPNTTTGFGFHNDLFLPGSFPADVDMASSMSTAASTAALEICPTTTVSPISVHFTSNHNQHQPLSMSQPQLSLSWPHSISQFAAATIGDAVLGRRIRL